MNILSNALATLTIRSNFHPLIHSATSQRYEYVAQWPIFVIHTTQHIMKNTTVAIGISHLTAFRDLQLYKTNRHQQKYD